MKKCFSFNSKYLPNFHVVEQREGNLRKLPHTDQLPKLLEALKKEFRDGIPDKIARVDYRSNGFMKIQRFFAAMLFCSHLNRARQDNLRLFALTDRNLVTGISIVQHITQQDDGAPIHRFKFYGGGTLFLDFHLNGRRIAFANHTIERFSERLPNAAGTDLTNLFKVVFGSPAVLMLCNETPCFVYGCDKSIIALPVRDSDTDNEFFFPTCLSINEINKLEMLTPTPAYALHYESDYTMPTVRNWNPIEKAAACFDVWTRKVQPSPPPPTRADNMSWSDMGHKITDVAKDQGHGEGSQIVFFDQTPGPCTIKLVPGNQELRYTDLDWLEKNCPGKDWKQIIARVKTENPLWFGGAKTP